jgi:nucleotide-binding universal stress UspA family protein
VGALQRALMGSVSQAVLNRANLPVLIVKPVEKEEAESADQ